MQGDVTALQCGGRRHWAAFFHLNGDSRQQAFLRLQFDVLTFVAGSLLLGEIA
ncbi:hypothetical protein D3C76_1762910 [compost metagenome]